MKQPFSKNISIAEPFHLDYIIHFYIPKKGLSGPVFTIKILLADIAIRQIIKVLPRNLSDLN